jgi:CheY-like chemotaxis protein
MHTLTMSGEATASLATISQDFLQVAPLAEIRAPERLNILLVEDDEADAFLIRRALANHPRVGSVTLAEDGMEALELVDKRRIQPDLAIVDLKMPRKDGLSFLRDIAARPNAYFPCAVLTSSKSAKDAQRAKNRGAVEFVSKPKSLLELRQALDRVIKRFG